MPIDEARLKEIERDLQFWGEHYDDAGDIEAAFPAVILELVEEIRRLNAEAARRDKEVSQT